MKFNWNYPTTVWVGENRINELSDACKNLNLTKPLFVTDKDLINLPFIKNIVSKNLKKFDNFTIFSNFTGNPTGENVDEGVEEFKKNNCDGVIAIGGGSARKFTEEVPREKVLKIEAIMDKSVNEKDKNMISVSKDAIIETVAEKILSQENSVNVSWSSIRFIRNYRIKTCGRSVKK